MWGARGRGGLGPRKTATCGRFFLARTAPLPANAAQSAPMFGLSPAQPPGGTMCGRLGADRGGRQGGREAGPLGRGAARARERLARQAPCQRVRGDPNSRAFGAARPLLHRPSFADARLVAAGASRGAGGAHHTPPRRWPHFGAARTHGPPLSPRLVRRAEHAGEGGGTRRWHDPQVAAKHPFSPRKQKKSVTSTTLTPKHVTLNLP